MRSNSKGKTTTTSKQAPSTVTSRPLQHEKSNLLQHDKSNPLQHDKSNPPKTQTSTLIKREPLPPRPITKPLTTNKPLSANKPLTANKPPQDISSKPAPRPVRNTSYKRVKEQVKDCKWNSLPCSLLIEICHFWCSSMEEVLEAAKVCSIWRGHVKS